MNFEMNITQWERPTMPAPALAVAPAHAAVAASAAATPAAVATTKMSPVEQAAPASMPQPAASPMGGARVPVTAPAAPPAAASVVPTLSWTGDVAPPDLLSMGQAPGPLFGQPPAMQPVATSMAAAPPTTFLSPSAAESAASAPSPSGRRRVAYALEPALGGAQPQNSRPTVTTAGPPPTAFVPQPM